MTLVRGFREKALHGVRYRDKSALDGNPFINKTARVAGVYDLIAIVKADREEQLAHVLLDEIQQISGVVRTETLIELS
jgi:DNA-binding Lrp family transcriptional regulator